MDAIGRLLEPSLRAHERFYALPRLPHRLAPFEYAGLGSFPLAAPPLRPDVLRFEPTLPTMALEAVRDLGTGAVSGYRERAVATDPHSGGLDRPVGGGDGYVAGGRGVPFSPDGAAAAAAVPRAELRAFVDAAAGGARLLASPFERAAPPAAPPALPPELPPLDATPVADPWGRPAAGGPARAVLDDWDAALFAQAVPRPAFRFPFALDAFQRRAIRRLERGEPVFVAAPTSAGKTVVAQYAVALCRSHRMRAIYTSPIKALSNQKYRDFARVFGDVGILTGDVSLNRDAAVLIMTTEILRAMLYRGADVLRDVECVVFDECHYISDPERGVVWEESIIMMPPHINMVFLSATAPNDMEIASWIAHTRRRPVFIERHLERPVPLVHMLYSTAGLFPIGDSVHLNEQSYDRVRASLRGGRGTAYQPSFWADLVRCLDKASLLPALIFFFSQRACDEFAESVRGKVKHLLTKEDRAHVRQFCHAAVARLEPEDRALPQVERVLALAQDGIGVHHGGMLPLLKEVVEMMLADGYLKVLFCTSTFAMGINVPARTCCFAALTKFNGKEFVLLTPTEYVQMSGRAGRRGLDKEGTSVIVCTKDMPEPDYLRQILRGQGGALASQFRLRPNMILGLVRVQGMGMVDLLRRTLSASAVQAPILQKQMELAELEEALARRPRIDCLMGDIEDAALGFAETARYLTDLVKRVDRGGAMARAVEVGRIAFVVAQTVDIAVITTVGRKISVRTAGGVTLTVAPENVCALFSDRIAHPETRAPSELQAALLPYRRRAPLPLDAVVPDVNPADSEEAQALLEALRNSQCLECPQVGPHYTAARDIVAMQAKCDVLREECDSGQDAFLPLLNHHVLMLERLGCIAEGVVTLKGRIALEMTTTAHELICAELLVNNFFDGLPSASLGALVSCLVVERGSRDEAEPLEELVEKVEEMAAAAQAVADAMTECSVEFEKETWVANHVNPVALKATQAWLEGATFAACMKDQPLTAGQLVRVLHTTATQCDCFAKGAVLVGNKGLAEVFEQTATAMKRGIIFTQSLYLD
jgi:antiviral helicase SKI2